nr:2-aminomuconic semialdehyde dehydrogenase-like [Cherax quadricarinatus]
MMEEVLVLNNFIAGTMLPCKRLLDSYDPSTGQVWAKVPDSGQLEVEAAVAAAKRAFPKWSSLSAQERANYLLKVADLLESRLEEFAVAESQAPGCRLIKASLIHNIPNMNVMPCLLAFLQFSSVLIFLRTTTISSLQLHHYYYCHSCTTTTTTSATPAPPLLLLLLPLLHHYYYCHSCTTTTTTATPAPLLLLLPLLHHYYYHSCTTTTTTAIKSNVQPEAGVVNYTLREPMGVAGLISPWNLPLYLLTFKLAPALMCGNTVVAKPSEMTSVTAYMFCKILQEVDFPAGVVNMVFGLGPTAGEALVTHPDVPLISFTGSTVTGRHIAQVAAPMFKKLSLESAISHRGRVTQKRKKIPKKKMLSSSFNTFTTLTHYHCFCRAAQNTTV